MSLGPNQTLSASANYYYDIYQYPDSIESIPIFFSGGAGLDAFLPARLISICQSEWIEIFALNVELGTDGSRGIEVIWLTLDCCSVEYSVY